MKRFIVVFLITICFGQMMFTAQMTRASDNLCQWLQWKRSDGLRVIYQAYNQRLVLIDKNREVVQVIEEGLIARTFEVVNYSPNCRYLVGSIPAGKRFDTVIWDLGSTPATRVAIFEGSFRDPYRVDWSPDSTYAVVSGREWADLLRLSDGNRARLTNKVISDCSRQMAGCVGNLYSHYGLDWHPEINQLQMTLTDGNRAIIDLNNGQPIDFRNRQGESLPVDKATILREQMASPYGCTPTVQYQLYNKRLVLKSISTGELVDVIQSDLLLKQYDFLGWSPNCNYIATAIDVGNGLVTVIWDTRSNNRVAELAYVRKNWRGFDWSTWLAN